MSHDEWELIPYDQRTKFQRFLYRTFGEERLRHWADRLAPKPFDRCPYRAPVLDDQCIRKAGHRGCCDTQTVHTNKRTGRSTVTTRSWYGINYD